MNKKIRLFRAIILPVLAGLSLASAGVYIATLTKILEQLEGNSFYLVGLMGFLVSLGSAFWLYRLSRISGLNHPSFSREEEKDESP